MNNLINSIKTPSTDLIEAYAMKPITQRSLIIRNGVMFILGGVSSGKSTLIAKLIKLYEKFIDPMILCFYSGFAPDETTQLMISQSDGKIPYYVQLTNNEMFVSFFNQFREKRLKFSELLLFLKSIYKAVRTKTLINNLMLAHELFNADTDDVGSKRLKFFVRVVGDTFPKVKSQSLYWSDYIMKTYANKRNIRFDIDPVLFVAHCTISLSKALETMSIAVLSNTDSTIKLSDRIKRFTFEPQLRINKTKDDIELIPSVCIFDDVAQFPLLTAERASQWVKDLLAETRRFQNTFIVAAQRHSLLNKSLRSLTHTFFIGYSLIDDDISRIAKEMPTNILKADDFVKLYHEGIKPFSFFVYNNKLGFDLITLKPPKQQQKQ